MTRHRKRTRGRRKSVLHVQQVLEWADEFHARTGRWPKKDDGHIPGTADEKWRNLDNALRYGLRGFPGAWSLAQLLADYRNVRNISSLPPYTVKQILAWAEAHYQHTGLWPTPKSGPILDAPGESWMAVHGAPFSGGRGGRKAAEKIFCCVTTLGLKIGVGSRLRRGLGSLTAHSFGGGVLGFDLFVLAAFGLTTGGLPAADLLAAFRILAIPLVPAAWSELPSAAAAETTSGTWSALSSGTPLV